MLEGTRKSIENNMVTIEKHRKETDARYEKLRQEIETSKSGLDEEVLRHDLNQVRSLQATMSEEYDQMDADHKELAKRVKKLEGEVSTLREGLEKIDILDDKTNKLSEQVITEQVKTRMQIDEIKDDVDELEKKFNSKPKEVSV